MNSERARGIFDFVVEVLLVVVFTLPGWGFLLAAGGHPTVVELSNPGYLLICLVTIAGAATSFCWLLRKSRSGSVDTYWIDKRRQRPMGWFWHVIGLSLSIALVAGVLGRLWIDVLIRTMPAETAVVRGSVAGFMRASSVSPYCRYFVEVSPGFGGSMKLCEERGLIARVIPAPAARLSVGDAVNIQLKKTALGTTAEIN